MPLETLAQEVRHGASGCPGKGWQETRRPMSRRTRGRARPSVPSLKGPAGLVVCHQEWSANPLFERKDNKKEALLDLDGRVANLNKRYAAVKDAGVRIQAMVVVRRPRGAGGWVTEEGCFGSCLFFMEGRERRPR